MATKNLAFKTIIQNEANTHLTYSEFVTLMDIILANVINITTTAPPGSPTEGDAYIIAATATGDWTGKENQIAIWHNLAWRYIVPAVGLSIWDTTTKLKYTWYDSAWKGTQTTGIGSYYPVKPVSSQTIFLLVMVETIDFADDFGGSEGYIVTNPTASYVMDVHKNGVSIGSITISTGGVFTFVTTGGAETLVPGDRLEIIAPGTADTTAAGICVTFRGNK